MGKILTRLDLHRLDKDFQLLERRTQQSQSWLQHFFDLWYIWLGHKTNTLANIPDIGGVLRTLSPDDSTHLICNLLLASQAGGCGSFFPWGQGFLVDKTGSCGYVPRTGDEWGIVVGSGNTPVTPQDDDLETKIVQGQAAGELLHGGTEILPPTFANPNGQMILRRYFTNASGGNVTCEEVGMRAPGFDTSGDDLACLFGICRDVVAPAVVIADTELLMATYTIGITV